MARERTLQLHLGAVQCGPTAEVLASLVADADGVRVQLFAHDPTRRIGGVLARLGAQEWAELKALVAEVDAELETGRFVLTP